MATEQGNAFARAFDRLLRAFKRHEDVDRDPDNFPEIGDVRAELDDARSEVRATRPTPPIGGVQHEAPSKVDVSDDDRRRVRAQFFPQN